MLQEQNNCKRNQSLIGPRGLMPSGRAGLCILLRQVYMSKKPSTDIGGAMAANARTIRLFLVDGSPTGIITAEIMNWTGHVLFAPRSSIPEILKRPEADRTGIYILVGADPDNPSRRLVYIGESDNVGHRLTQHNRDESKGFWETTCIVTNKDANLTKAHVRFLESRLIDLAGRDARVKLLNGTSPDFGYLPESDISDMEYVIAQLQTLLPVLGLDFFRPVPQLTPKDSKISQSASDTESETDTSNSRRIFGQERPTADGGRSPQFVFFDGSKSIQARAIETDGQMVILKGSEAREEERPSLASNVKIYRDQLRQSGKLVQTDKPGVLRFAEDVAFSSPSAAAQAVMGTSRNGRTDWKIADTEETYADWQEAQIALANQAA